MGKVGCFQTGATLACTLCFGHKWAIFKLLIDLILHYNLSSLFSHNNTRAHTHTHTFTSRHSNVCPTSLLFGNSVYKNRYPIFYFHSQPIVALLNLFFFKRNRTTPLVLWFRAGLLSSVREGAGMSLLSKRSCSGPAHQTLPRPPSHRRLDSVLFKNSLGKKRLLNGRGKKTKTKKTVERYQEQKKDLKMKFKSGGDLIPQGEGENPPNWRNVYTDMSCKCMWILSTSPLPPSLQSVFFFLLFVNLFCLDAWVAVPAYCINAEHRARSRKLNHLPL